MNDRNYYKLQTKLYDFFFDKKEITVIEYCDEEKILGKTNVIHDINSYVTEWGGDEVGVTEITIEKDARGNTIIEFDRNDKIEIINDNHYKVKISNRFTYDFIF